jgi:hypothetical protein
VALGYAGAAMLAPFDAPALLGQDRGAPPLIEQPQGPVAGAFVLLAVAERIGATADTPAGLPVSGSVNH